MKTAISKNKRADTHISLIAVCASRRLMKFMQACDMLSDNTVAGFINSFDVTIEQAEYNNPELFTTLLEEFRKLLESKGEIVSLVHILKWTIGKVDHLNDNTYPPYINKKIQFITDGINSFHISDYLVLYNITTNEQEE